MRSTEQCWQFDRAVHLTSHVAATVVLLRQQQVRPRIGNDFNEQHTCGTHAECISSAVQCTTGAQQMQSQAYFHDVSEEEVERWGALEGRRRAGMSSKAPERVLVPLKEIGRGGEAPFI
jgi:hypothetical protein